MNTVMTEDEFDTKYEPMESPEGSDIWERHDVLALLDAGTITEKQVWSFVDDGEGGTGTIAGWHMVNLLGYQVTKVPWVEGDETVEHEQMHTCYYCGTPIERAADGSWTDGVDETCIPDHTHTDDPEDDSALGFTGDMDTCTICHRAILRDAKGTWVDPTGGDVCMDNDGNDGPHKPESEEN